MNPKTLEDKYGRRAVQSARIAVAAWYKLNAMQVRSEDAYASHVSEAYKDKRLASSLVHASEVLDGRHDSNFSVWQRLVFELTGKTVALLP